MNNSATFVGIMLRSAPMRRAIVTALLAVLTLACSTAYAEIKFYTDVTPKAGTMDDTYVFSVVIEGSDEAAYPFLTGGEDFKLTLIGPRSNMSIVNGVVSIQAAYNYSLTPKHEGLLETPAADLEVGGKKYHADPLQVKIMKGADVPQNQPANSNAFIKQYPDKQEAYVGEQIVDTVELWHSISLYDPVYSDQPFDGFWAQSMGEDQKSTRVLDGRNFTIIRTRKALYPLKSGELTIPPRELKAKAREQKRGRGAFPFGYDPYDDQIFDEVFGAGKMKDLAISSAAVALQVKPLPAPPSDYDGWNAANPLVGPTQLSLSSKPDAVHVGDSKTIRIDVTSEGNLNPINEVPIAFPKGVKIYQEPARVESREIAGRLVTTKSYSLSIVPLTAGIITIPALHLSYFDPESGSYKIAATNAFTFEALGDGSAASNESAVAPLANPTAEPTVPATISAAPSPTPSQLSYADPSTTEAFLAKISAGSLALIALALLIVGQLAYLLIRVARRGAPRRDALSKVAGANTLNDLSLAIRSYLALLWGQAALAHGDHLRATLNAKLTNAEQRFALQSLMDELEAGLYGGASADLATLRERARKILRTI